MPSAVEAQTAAKLLSHWYQHPEAFIRDALGGDPWDVQAAIAASVRDNKRTAVASCNATGKDWLAARLAIWWLIVWEKATVVTTAPSWHQVKDIIWGELHDAYSRAKVQLGPVPNVCDWSLGPKREALALSTREKEKAMGIHNDNVLVIITEASGMPEDVMDGLDTLMAGGNAHMLLISQPSKRSGQFWRAWTTERQLYKTIRIPYDITPNFRNKRKDGSFIVERPYLITPEWVDEKRIKWGEGSPLWDVHVMAQFPKDDESRLLPIDALEAAIGRELYQPDPIHSMGIDVARFGKNLTVYTFLHGGQLVAQHGFRAESTMETAGRAQAYKVADPTLRIAVDTGGVGGGVADKLEEEGVEFKSVMFGQSADDKSRYADRLSEIYWQLRTVFMNGLISIPVELESRDELLAQLSLLEYKFTSRGQIKVFKPESFDHTSPDYADSLALAVEAQAEFSGAEAFII